MSATLRVTRELGFGIELRRGRFEVLVDGTSAGPIDNHQTIETPVESGPHTVRIRKGRYTSGARVFDAADGEVVNFHCHGVRIWPMYLASIVMPNLAIALKRE
jgi:hypothetical protein